jgi:hypothetical protein
LGIAAGAKTVVSGNGNRWWRRNIGKIGICSGTTCGIGNCNGKRPRGRYGIASGVDTIAPAVSGKSCASIEYNLIIAIVSSLTFMICALYSRKIK